MKLKIKKDYSEIFLDLYILMDTIISLTNVNSHIIFAITGVTDLAKGRVVWLKPCTIEGLF